MNNVKCISAMKKLYFTILMLIFSLIAQSQNISVKEFYYAENDLTARTHGTTVEDQNGYLCALIKVETTEKGLWSFDVGMLGVTRTETQNTSHPAEIWVYVPYGVTWISIQHDQLGKLNRYTFPCGIEKGNTYVMKLVTGKVNVLVEPTFTQQFLVFNVTPQDAMVTVDGEPWPVNNGRAEKLVDLGKKYEYRVEAQDYHTEIGKIEVSDPDNKVEKTVVLKLKPGFGFLKIEGEQRTLSEATVRVDKANGAEALGREMKVVSGRHDVTIAHPKYKPYSSSVTVNDGDTTLLQVSLEANFSTVTLRVDDEAEIYVNGERKGLRVWTGDLAAGKYFIECRKQNHRNSLVEKTITDKMSGDVITLNPPTPINGQLVVSSSPSGARIMIDGKQMGETPMQIPAILIGEHRLRLEKSGSAPLAKTVIIEEGKTLTISEKLGKGCDVLVKTDRQGDTIYVDEDYVGETPRETPLGYGRHIIRVERDGERVEREVEITENSRNGQELMFEFNDMIANTTVKESAPIIVDNGVYFVTMDAAYSVAPQISYGVTFGSVKKAGWFVTFASNYAFDAMNYTQIADANGLVDGDYYYDYTGASCSTRISAMAGTVMRLASPVYVKIGAGYGTRVKSWYIANGGLVKMSDDSFSGLDATAGLMLNLKGFTISLDAVTTNFKTVEAKIGLGFSWKRK